MPLKLLCDENLPSAVINFLEKRGCDVRRVKPSSPDSAIASQAKREKRIILTFDSDFANILVYPPQKFFGIIRVKIDPPFINIVINSLALIFRHFKTPKEFRGKLIIAEPEGFRVWEA